jgi:hypothetical protein
LNILLLLPVVVAVIMVAVEVQGAFYLRLDLL